MYVHNMSCHVVMIHLYSIAMFQYDSEEDDDTVEVTKKEQVVCLSTACGEDMYVTYVYCSCIVCGTYNIIQYMV